MPNTPQGSANRSSKLTEEDVIAIRKDTRPYKEVAAEYGVHWQTIKEIIKGNEWKHLPSATNQKPDRRRKLTENDVRLIRKDTRHVTDIAAYYGVSRVTIDLVLQRKTWKHIV